MSEVVVVAIEAEAERANHRQISNTSFYHCFSYCTLYTTPPAVVVRRAAEASSWWSASPSSSSLLLLLPPAAGGAAAVRASCLSRWQRMMTTGGWGCGSRPAALLSRNHDPLSRPLLLSNSPPRQQQSGVWSIERDSSRSPFANLCSDLSSSLVCLISQSPAAGSSLLVLIPPLLLFSFVAVPIRLALSAAMRQQKNNNWVPHGLISYYCL